MPSVLCTAEALTFLHRLPPPASSSGSPRRGSTRKGARLLPASRRGRQSGIISSANRSIIASPPPPSPTQVTDADKGRLRGILSSALAILGAFRHFDIATLGGISASLHLHFGLRSTTTMNEYIGL